MGATDFLTLSAGVSLIPFISEQVLYFAPKVGVVHNKHLDLAAGLLYLNVPESDDFGVTYSVITIGNPSGGVTTGIGYGFQGGNWAESPLVLFGGDVQVSNSAKLLTENWIYTGEENFVMFSGGIRFFGENMAVDFGLITWDELLSDGGFPFVPWVDFAVNW